MLLHERRFTHFAKDSRGLPRFVTKDLTCLGGVIAVNSHGL